MKKKILVLFVTLTAHLWLMAQPEVDNLAPIGSSTNLFVKHYSKGVQIELNIGIQIAGQPSINNDWNLCTSIVADCNVGTVYHPGDHYDLAPAGLRLDFNLDKVVLSGTLPVSNSNMDAEYTFTLKAANRGGSNNRSYRIIVRSPKDIVFVLDRSGSMECAPMQTALWPACTTSVTKRWNILKDATDNFVRKLDPILFTIPNDRMSVSYFAGTTQNGLLIPSDATPFKPVIEFRGATVVAGTPTPIKEDMERDPIWLTVGDHRLGRDGTSIGAGLLQGFDRFRYQVNTSSRKIIVLFSDGEQNSTMSKWVVSNGVNSGKIIQPAQSNVPNAADFNTTSRSDIEIYSSALLIAPVGATLMSDIATNSDHYVNVMAANEMGFISDLSAELFLRIYKDHSPQLIRFDKRTISYGQTAQSDFDCNKNVNRLIFEAYFDDVIGKDVKYKILKDGIDVTQYGKTLTNSDYIHTIAFNMYEIRDLKSEGKWSFQIIGGSDNIRNSPVRLFATADDHAIKFDATLANKAVRVGDAMKPTVKLFENGQPVTNATVKAIILKPGDDIGDLLARAQINALPLSTPESGTCGDQKYSYLQANNPLALAKLKNIQESTIVLTHQGNGTYKGSYSDVEFCGTYKVRYIVNYTSPQLGKVERMIEQTVNVTFPELDFSSSVPPKTSEGNAIYKRGDTSFFPIAVFKPTYKVSGQTRYVGPGFEHAFGVSGVGVTLSEVKDNCDGSYNFTLKGVDLNQRIDVYLTDKVIYSGPAKNFLTGFRRFDVSLHGGFTILIEGLGGGGYKTGVYSEGNLSYRINNKLSVELIGGYYGFSNSYNIVASTINVKGHLPLKNDWEATAAIGTGGYKPKDKDLKNGITVKINAGKYFFNKKIVAGFDFGYHYVKDYNIKFLTLGVGAKLYL